MKLLNYTLLSMGLIMHAGCTQSSPVNEPPAQIDNLQSTIDNPHSVAGHGHGAGPHDGTIVDWGGGKYHVEFTVDHDKQEGTVYILGADEKTPTPIKSEEVQLFITDPAMEVTLKPTPQEGDPEGTASRYIGNHEKLGVVQEYAGTITGVIDDTPYSGDFAEEAHDH